MRFPPGQASWSNCSSDKGLSCLKSARKTLIKLRGVREDHKNNQGRETGKNVLDGRKSKNKSIKVIGKGGLQVSGSE